MNQKKGLMLILLSTLMFGSYSVWSRLIGNNLSPFYQSWVRGFIIAVVLLPILLWRKEIIAIPKKDWGWLSVFLITTSLTQAPIFYAFNHMDIGAASLLFFCSTLLTMYILGVVFFGEKITKVKAFSFILAIIGMYVVFSFSLVAFSLFAASMAIFNGCMSGGELSFSKKLTGNYSALYMSWLSWVIIFITNGIVSIFLGETQVVPSFNVVWLYVLGYSIVSIFGFWMVMEGLKDVEAGVGGLFGLFEIIFSILFAIIWFHEVLTVRIVVGGMLIIIASALPHMFEKNISNEKIN